MANPTSNFGWQMPTSSDLVTDLPADFEVFGQAVDTSMADLKGGTTGQVLKKNSNTDMDFVWSADSAGMTNPMTTTGDTIYSSSGSTPARLGIGSSGQVLTVSGGVPSWATPASGSLTQLATGTLSGASVTISAISGSYKHLQLIIRDAIPTTQAGLRLRFNSDNGGNYMNFDTTSSGSSQTFGETYATISSDIDTTSDTLCVTQIWDYANSVTMKLSNALCISQNSATPNYNLKEGRSAWNNTTAITSITIMYYTGNHNGGTYYLYGVN